MGSDPFRYVSLIEQFGCADCRCVSRGDAPCEVVAMCAREAVLRTGREVIIQLKSFRLLQKQIASLAGVHRTALNKWEAGREDPRLGLDRLVAAVGNMRNALIKLGKESFAKTAPTQTVPLKTVDFSSGHGVADSQRKEAEGIVSANILSAIIDRPASDRKRLPKNVHASVSQLGDPGYHMWVVAVADPEVPDDAATEIAIYDKLIHELNHILQRYKERRGTLTKGTQRFNPPPLRLS